MTKPWTYQLAHEIKTPLSILSFDVESLTNEDLKDKSLTASMKDQIERISIIVSQFLEWASVENTQQKDNLFGLRIASSIEAQIEGLERLYPARMTYTQKEDFMVISNPQHLQQLINNLLTNALNYSPSDSKVLIETFDNTLRVTDTGHGIPNEVLERIGQPFNCGPQLPQIKHKRSGLGLAWINTITKIYNWDLSIQSEITGTVITIKFTKNLTT
jgi:two-component system sensor histidine kinase QseC